jgi:hypothetical protein
VKLPWVSRARLEAEQAHSARLGAQLEAFGTLCDTLRRDARADYTALMERYHALRAAGHDPAPAAPEVRPSPLAALGPKTAAALHEMGQGQALPTRRAMAAKVLSLAADGMADDVLARAVRRGEVGVRVAD